MKRRLIFCFTERRSFLMGLRSKPDILKHTSSNHHPINASLCNFSIRQVDLYIAVPNNYYFRIQRVTNFDSFSDNIPMILAPQTFLWVVRPCSVIAARSNDSKMAAIQKACFSLNLYVSSRLLELDVTLLRPQLSLFPITFSCLLMIITSAAHKPFLITSFVGIPYWYQSLQSHSLYIEHH